MERHAINQIEKLNIVKKSVSPNLIYAVLLLLLSHFSHVGLCATPQMAAHQAPPSLGFSRQEYWSGLPFPLQCMKVKSESEAAQSCPTLVTPWTAAHQAPPSMGFSRQEYWSRVPLPSLNLIYRFEVIPIKIPES